MLWPCQHTAEQHKLCPLLHWQQHGRAAPRGTAFPNPPGQPCLAHPRCWHALCPSQHAHSWWEEQCVTFLLYLPTSAPQTPANLWCLLYFKIITSELTCGSGMIQPGAAFPEGWSQSRAAGLAAQAWGGWPWVLFLSCKIVFYFQHSRKDLEVCGSWS